MIGDINLFITDTETGEVNVMIADIAYRKRGLASQAITFMINFAKKLNLKHIYAKILEENQSSARVFQRLGFVEVNRIPDFEEIHYCLEI